MKDEIKLLSVVKTNNEASWFYKLTGVVFAVNRYGVKVLYPDSHVHNLQTFLPWSEVELAEETLDVPCSLN